MKTQSIMSLLMAFTVTVAALTVSGCSKADHEASAPHAHQYTCKMHPEVVQDAPGNCPKCGMALTEKH